MAKFSRMTSSRLKLVFKRQANPGWAKNYTPGILATRAEAPSLSNASVLQSAKFDREVHTLSKGERAFAVLGFYHPKVVGLQEQRMIPGHTIPHPLAAWPGTDQLSLLPLRGLEEISEEFGFRRQLHGIAVTLANGDEVEVTCPWFGDQLWAISDDGHGVRCLNWSIKNQAVAFRRRRKRIATFEEKDDEQAINRMVGEKAHYASGKIRTVHLSHEDLPRDLEANLVQLFLHHSRHVDLSESQCVELEERLQAALEFGIPPSEVITRFRARHEVSVHEPRSYFYQLIWKRRLMVDLFRPVLIDQPMRPMDKDPLAAYASWFDPRGGEK